MRELLAKEQFRLDRLQFWAWRHWFKRRWTVRNIASNNLRCAPKVLTLNVLLARGYSITLVNGRIVRDPDALQVGDVVETRVEKGSFLSTVKETHNSTTS